MIEDIVRELSAYNEERSWFEFKENWYEPVAIGEYISALSNSAAFEGRENAFFVWGISDDTHEYVGTDFNYNQDYRGEPMEHYLSRNMFPDIDFRFSETRIEGKRIVVLTIPAAKDVPTAFNHIRYIRIGSSKVNLEKHPQKEKSLFDILSSGLPSINNTVSDFQDLSFSRLFTYYAGKGIELKTESFKTSLGLLTSSGKYNMLAQLLSDDSHIPIRVAIFSGQSKADTLYSIREFGNTCILLSLEKILEYIDVLNLIQVDETNRIVERNDVALFDNKAIREVIINAFVHNGWNECIAPMITVFSDRIEILSRGTLPPKQTIEGFFRGDSVPVNDRLSRIFIQLHISEITGRGIPKILSIYYKSVFDIRDNSILVTILFKRINKVGDKVGNKVGNKSKTVRLNTTQIKVLSEIRDNPNVTAQQLMNIIGLGKTAIQNNVSYLRKNGYIDRIGSNKTGYWKVNES